MKYLIIVSLTLFCLAAGAADLEPTGLYISEGLIGYSIQFNTGTSSILEKTLGSSETSLGYVIGGWIFIGGVFNYTAVEEKSINALKQSTTHQEIFQYYGPAFGWMGTHWLLIGHYYANAEKKDNVSGDGILPYTSDNTGSGYAVNLGYRFDFGVIEGGPVISYKVINYLNCKDPYTGITNACNPSINQSEITPYLTIFANFK